MSFLLFLASLAVLEFLLRGTGQKSGAGAKTGSTSPGHVIDPGPVLTETATTDLLALGNALHSQQVTPAPEQVKAESKS